ncbi:MAG: SpoIIE family protein phosphatase [Acidobacteriia bacterium]|nr:SpoIIE family protein phosphatase [Terriglobia bacterium]
MRTRVELLFRWLGGAGVAFVLLLTAYAALGWIAPRSGFRLVLEIASIIAGLWLAIRLLRMAARQAVWRLRHRLLITYLFIAVVPIVLIVGLAALGGYMLVYQLAAYLVTTELDHRIDGLPAAVSGSSQDRYPGIAVVPVPAGGFAARGVLKRDGNFYIFSNARTSRGEVIVTVPLTREYLAGLVPGLGLVGIDQSAEEASKAARVPSPRSAVPILPPAANRFDTEVVWFATVPAFDWSTPGRTSDMVLAVLTRVSAVLSTVFNRRADVAQDLMQSALIAGLIVFALVQIICWVIGFSMTRNITGAVHHLYEGTNRIMQGDFSHRIEVRGKDQLAELGVSFNRMTENLAHLLTVAKEKERLQSEIEIAREVQNQLYPRVALESKSLRLTAVCRPARIVSGDYYDFEITHDAHVALAIGDVAGKGISAALLMATLQSSLRTQLNTQINNGRGPRSAAQLVSQLNHYLYANTSAEKYTTLCLGLYDEAGSSFIYSNGGHLPPALVRGGVVRRLDVNGTVVGAFPFAEYGESRIVLEPGDLLVFFTDGVTEPENAYGEMFGEERFLDLLARNAHLGEEEIVRMVIESIREWTGSEELQDDMTLLLARRV